jgi:drug/metabolite transporter (DMT)-like permease
MVPSWLWVVFTLVGATGQSLRNAAQQSLTGRLGTVGATHVRFLFGLPFGLLALAAVGLVYGGLPAPTLASLTWTIFGGLTQIAATALMLATMRERSFVVTTAYTKTEPVQVALFSIIFLGEHVGIGLGIAVVVATAGVIVLSWPSRAGRVAWTWRPALLGILSGGLFALSAIGFRGGILALGAVDFVPAATLTLALSLTFQTILLSAWLALRSPDVLRAIGRAWRQSLAAGFLGSFASEMWFLAFALETPAKVRTLGLVEIIVAGMISRRLFAQTTGIRELAGMALIVGGILLLFNV